MTQVILESELKTCGKAFFVDYFNDLNKIDWHDEEQIKSLKKKIADDLLYKRRPDGGNYTSSGLEIRFASFFVIFSQNLQWKALENISQSTGVSEKTHTTAKALVEKEHQRLAYLEQAKLQEQQAEIKRAEEATLRLKQREEEIKEAARRKKAQRLAYLSELQETHSKLQQERREQQAIIESNRGWFWGKKAKIRKLAKSRLLEIEKELIKISKLLKSEA